MNLSKFFCKPPLIGFCYGPSGLNVYQAQPFTTEWRGEFIPNIGVKYSSSLETGEYIISTNEHSGAYNFSLSFESGNLLWYCLSESGKVHVVKNSAPPISYSFSGDYGQIYNNSVIALNKNDTICVYGKKGAIYSRSSNQSFLVETLIYSGLSPYFSINQVYKTRPPNLYHMSVFGTDAQRNGLEIVLRREDPFTSEYFDSFNSCDLGRVQSLNYSYFEGPATYFIDGSSHYLYNDFSLLPVTGDYPGFLN